MDLKLSNKRAIITGASSGIGISIKEALLEEGVEVHGLSRTNGIDLMTQAGIEWAKQRMKYFDILINNIGGGGTWAQHEYKVVMEKNYGLMVELTNEFLKTKRDYGRVITISSIYGKEKGQNPGFTAAKSAQIAYMKSLAGKYQNITLNTICPGYINTKKEIKVYAKSVKAPVGQPEDVANIVTFLCSNRAKFINGSCIVVDGGYSHAF